LACSGKQLFNAVDVSPFATYGTEKIENWADVLSREDYASMETLRGLKTFRKPWGNERKPLLECL
jgi:hypothetical protein